MAVLSFPGRHQENMHHNLWKMTFPDAPVSQCFSGHISYIILRYFEDCAQEKEIVPIIRRPQQTAGGARPRRNVVARSLAATVFWCCEQVAAGLANSKVWSSFLWISCGAQFLLDVLTCLGDRRKTYADVSKEECSHEC